MLASRVCTSHPIAGVVVHNQLVCLLFWALTLGHECLSLDLYIGRMVSKSLHMTSLLLFSWQEHVDYYSMIIPLLSTVVCAPLVINKVVTISHCSHPCVEHH